MYCTQLYKNYYVQKEKEDLMLDEKILLREAHCRVVILDMPENIFQHVTEIVYRSSEG